MNKHFSFHTIYLLLRERHPLPGAFLRAKNNGEGASQKKGAPVCAGGRIKRECLGDRSIREKKKMSRSGRWPMIRRQVWDRDRKAKAPCHICGGSIDYSLRPSSCPDSWEPDHIIPVSKRPDLELDMSNIKASHMRCNRARGDGTNGENDLGMQSRIW